ncbi:MAG: hypothetical protein K0R29_88 [Pseudobdellovibrio sp.]|jgi:hypothetical protein|nr:hypothetical protein [Pseudobdellovibrio sp.]
MSKLVIAVACLLGFQIAHAQSFKVVKIAGKKAIVEVDDPKMINVNQTYTVGGGGDMMGSSYTGGSGGYKRDNALTFDFSYRTQSSPSISTLSLSGSYLWNLKQYEFGPLLGIANISGSGASTNVTTFGGLGYYNLNENKPGVPTVLAVVGELSITSGSGSSVTNISAGGNYRWFLLSGDHCFSTSLLYNLSQSSGNNTSGFSIESGIATYF